MRCFRSLILLSALATMHSFKVLTMPGCSGFSKSTRRFLKKETKPRPDKTLPFVHAFRDCAVLSPSDKHRITEVSYTGSSGAAVLAWKASPAMKTWPMFDTVKQISAAGTDVLCLPWDEVSRTRREHVMNTLRGVRVSGEVEERDSSCGRDVVIVGATGIGKSTEMDFYLREFVRNMGKENWPSTVLYRCPERLIALQLEENDGQQRIKQTVTEDLSLCSLDFFIRKHYDGEDVILLLEMDEIERGPIFSCPTLVSLESDDAKSKVKTMDKSGARFFIMSPPSAQQVELMAKAMLQLSDDRKYLLENLGVHSGSKEEEDEKALQIVRERVQQVGPLQRIVFGDEHSFNWRMSDMRSVKVSEFGVSDVFDTPRKAKYFVAPIVRPDAPSSLYGKCMEEDGEGVEQLSFLCERAARIAANEVENRKDARSLSFYSSSLGYQIAELFMRDALTSLEKRESWDIHEDVGPHRELSASTRLPSSDQEHFKDGTLLPVMQKTLHDYETFRGASKHTERVSELQEHTLYCSQSHNIRSPGAVGECVAVDHANKVVFCFQPTAEDPSEHAFRASALLRAMRNLGLDADEHKDYKLKLVVFADVSLRETHGCAFQYDVMNDHENRDGNSGGSASISRRTLSLSELKAKAKEEGSNSSDNDMLTRIETVIIRCRFYANYRD